MLSQNLMTLRLVADTKELNKLQLPLHHDFIGVA